MKNALRSTKNVAQALPWQVAAATGIWQGHGAPVKFVSERINWAIQTVGENIGSHLNHEMPNVFEMTTEPYKDTNRVVHFGSQYMWLTWHKHMPRGNRYVTSFFHGKPEDGPDVAQHIEDFVKSSTALDKIVTGASIVEKRLVEWGVPQSKIHHIPIGVDTKKFVPPSQAQKEVARQKFGIKPGEIVIGSFQKDGVGWGDGMEPKLIKGPDRFVDVVFRLAKEYPVKVFLTGPARGYVKSGLEKLGIEYIHQYPKDHTGLVECYWALDLYLMTSREEGGPMGLTEGMASGVPVISTAVGMAPDLLVGGLSGGLIANYSADSFVEAALCMLSDQSHIDRVRVEGRQEVERVDWGRVAQAHWDQVYSKLVVS
ncbi:glycosyltransferase family 4 protein [Thalassospira sp. GB04J01]|uniref:glycosyltransferase family 4 protein n=1 Tax=Thalassospira sp. GB04J01 TaxID=1485225 RepID=UPI000C9AE95B|nr:glycosyltransferase family 4 protein [Thalassospira sp. GB04J01]|tara:strand:+ start:119179 stop:120288 length:1110 start_codon:yes stop_codon:yes gene_type:complete